MKNNGGPQCAVCNVKDRACRVKDGEGPDFCPTKKSSQIIERVHKEYEKAEIREFARMASIQEGEGYANREIKPFVRHPIKPRVQEICEFAKKMGYSKLGIAFCQDFMLKLAPFQIS